MRIVDTFPWFEIFISEKSDGDIRERDICSDIIRPTKQIHEREVYEVTYENRDTPFSDYDGVYTRCRDITIGSLCADCPVIILMGDGECASLHSGWRGTEAHILHAGLERFSTLREDIRVYIWPHISRDSYEVQVDFLVHFPREYFRFLDEKIYFDIEKYIIDDLISAWIKEEHIKMSPIDTFIDPDFYSYRRDGMIGLGIVGVRMI
jgi:YfiH family protein